MALAKVLQKEAFGLRGLRSTPFSGQVSAGFVFFSIQILFRVPSLIVLTICLERWVVVFVAIFVAVNFLVAFKLKTDVSKNIWSVLRAVVCKR